MCRVVYSGVVCSVCVYCVNYVCWYGYIRMYVHKYILQYCNT